MKNISYLIAALLIGSVVAITADDNPSDPSVCTSEGQSCSVSLNPGTNRFRSMVITQPVPGICKRVSGLGPLYCDTSTQSDSTQETTVVKNQPYTPFTLTERIAQESTGEE